jgi:hypothetical protein
MLADPTQRKTFTDARGVSHEWTCTPFATRHAITMLTKLADVMLGGGAQNLDQLLEVDVEKIQKDAKEKAAQGGGAFIGSLLTALGPIPARLLKHDGGEFVAELMAGCTRSYKDLAGKRHVLDLSKPELFDSIGRGNLGEVVAALRWVLEVNYGPLFGGVMSGFAGLLTAGTEKQSDGEEPTPTTIPATG